MTPHSCSASPRLATLAAASAVRASCSWLAFCVALGACSSAGSSIDPADPVELAASSAALIPPPPPAPVQKPWLVVLCKPSDYATVPPGDDVSLYRKLFATSGAGGLADYWRDQSWNNVDITGTVVTDWTTVPSVTSSKGSDGRQWINLSSHSDIITDCVNTQKDKLANFGSFYNYIALWNVVVGSQGGTVVTIGGRTLHAVALDVGGNTNATLYAHEMGHGWGLNHAFDDSFDTSRGKAGEYADKLDIMSAMNVDAYSGRVCTTDMGSTTANDCLTGPGLDIWGKMLMGWGNPIPGTGFSGPGVYATPQWPATYTGSITIGPRNHPELRVAKGIYIPAHKEYGYTVELQTPEGSDLGISPSVPQVVVRRVFPGGTWNGQPLGSYLVRETGGIQMDFAHPFVETNEGNLTIALATMAGSPPLATLYVHYSPGPGVWWNGDFGYPRVWSPTLGDWDPGAYKGQCEQGQAVAAVSRYPNSTASHGMMCGVRGITPLNADGSLGKADGSECRVLKAQSSDNRSTPDGGWDWDPGSYKTECAANEYVNGIAQGGGGLDAILCCRGRVNHNSCDAQVFYSGDSAAFAAPDWDLGYYKGQCPAGQYVAGVSTPAYTSVGQPGAAHGLLCCAP